MHRQSAREMVSALEQEIDARCPEPEGRRMLKDKLSALYRELTKDDEPVYRSALGNFQKIGR